MDDCIFCQLAKGIKPCHKIWEDEEFMAFLSIFPNTEGFTVVIPKNHYSNYAFDLPEPVLTKFMIACKKVGLLLDQKLDKVEKTSLILEPAGVDHLHAKLFPMHGLIDIPNLNPITAHLDKYFDKYEGYISSHDYIRADDRELEKTAKKISS